MKPTEMTNANSEKKYDAATDALAPAMRRLVERTRVSPMDLFVPLKRGPEINQSDARGQRSVTRSLFARDNSMDGERIKF